MQIEATYSDDSDQDNQNEALEASTAWANPPKLTDLKQDYTDAQGAHDTQAQKIDVWLDNMYIRNKAKVKTPKGRSKVVPRLIRKQAEWRYAALTEPFLSTEDVFNAAPVTFEDKQAAEQTELVLNYQFNTQIQKTAFIDELVRTVTDEGTGICRVGWDFQEKEIEVPDIRPAPIRDPEMAREIMQGIQMIRQNPQVAEQVPPEMLEAMKLTMHLGIPTMMQEVGTKLEMQTVKNQPTVEVCDYKNVLIDPTCEGNLDKANFIIYQFTTSLSELEKDGKYTNLDKINIESRSNDILAAPDSVIDNPVDFNFTDEPRKKFTAYEYWGFWDIHDTGIVEPIVATWVDGTLIRMEENPFPDKALPFVTVQYLPVRKSIYGEPDGALLEDNQKIIGAVTRGMIDIMARSANGQTGYSKDALDVSNRRKFDKGEDYEYNPTIDPRMAFHMHTFPEIPNSAPGMIEMQNNEAESLTGVKAFSSGITGQALGNTATGIRSAMDATSKRELGILRRIAEAVTQIGRKFISMNTEFLDEEMVVRITNDEFVPVRRDDLAGNIDLKLTISTAEADNEKAEQQAFMLQTTAQTMGPEFAKIILTEIARLRNMPALAKKIEAYEPQPDPLEQEKQQLEIQLLQAQIANEQAKANENNANANLDNAKVEETLAKAKALGSQADKSDLDFVEQESGLTQERDLQKMGEQARGNMALKAMESNLKKGEKAHEKALESRFPTPTNKP